MCDGERLMISPQLQQVLNNAVGLAAAKKHEYVTVEHILYSLLSDEEIKKIITACGGNVETIQKDVSEFIDSLTTKPSEGKQEIQTTIGFQRVIQRSVFHVQTSGKQEVLPFNLLIAIFAEKESHAVYFLEKENVNRLNVVEYVSHGMSSEDFEERLKAVIKQIKHASQSKDQFYPLSPFH